MKRKSKAIGKEVLTELDWFGKGFKVSGASATVMQEQLARMREPFVGWVRVMESIDGKEETERIYLVCRGHTPLNFDPNNELALFANRDAKVGRIASIDPGNDITISLPYNRGQKTIRVIEKDIFLPTKGKVWDARNNQIAFHLDDDYVPYLRAVLEVSAPKPAKEKVSKEEAPTPEALQRDGRETLEELRRLEDEQELALRALSEQKLDRVREIVDSIALKDQPILDSAQDEFCREPLKSQLILAGSPGTGKTTSIIKRIAMKADPVHLEETDGIDLSEDERTNWLIFTPNDLLKIYLKEAMNKEGLSATDQFVTTWEKERGLLGRDVLGFLKRKDKGLFTKNEESIFLTDHSSTGTSRAALEFIEFFDHEFVTALRLAIDHLSEVEIGADILTKETFPIADQFRRFASACRNLRDRLDGRVLTERLGSLTAVEELSKLSKSYSGARANADDLVNRLVDSWIEKYPDRFDDIVQFLQSSDADTNPPATEELDDAAEDELEEAEIDHPIIDPKLRAWNRIRQVIAGQAEAMATAKQIRGKDARFISEYVGMSEASPNELLLAGKIRAALKPSIFRVNGFNRLLARTPRSFQRFRLAEVQKDRKSLYRSDSQDAVRAFRVSTAEIDILIFAMLRIASSISESQTSLLESESRRDLLGKIADQFRTHIAVDEATDFSAVQLASIYYLTDPQYRAVTFSGDLMQRVTSGGLGDWAELKSLVPSVRSFELIASYRQTPTLLKIAKKLYTAIIGEEPPFDSKHGQGGNFPPPLKYSGLLDHNLAEWLSERIHEIYQINGDKLPSIAIFVPTENDIDPTQKILKEALNDYSIDVEACRLGKILGTGSNVRVFSIEFIKGLEFEGVFYIDIDRSYKEHPELVDKYLYVGLTRATTFMGVTYSTRLPATFEFLEKDLVSGDWKAFL